MSFDYLIRRLLLMIPTFLGITLVSFIVIQAAPGGPIESYVAKVRFAGGGGVWCCGCAGQPYWPPCEGCPYGFGWPPCWWFCCGAP